MTFCRRHRDGWRRTMLPIGAIGGLATLDAADCKWRDEPPPGRIPKTLIVIPVKWGLETTCCTLLWPRVTGFSRVFDFGEATLPWEVKRL